LSFVVGYEISGANLQKTLYEYGLIGFIALDGLFFRRVYMSRIKFPLKNAMAYMWLLQLNGSAEFFALFWIFSLWQKSGVIERAQNTMDIVGGEDKTLTVET